MSFLVVVSINGRIATAAHSRAVAWMSAFGFLEKFLCIFGIILAFCNAYFAGSVAWLAAIETKGASVIFAVWCGVRAGHDTI